MASTYKVLSQTIPSATTLTDSYTVPGATQAVVSTITVCNQAASAATYRLQIAVAGAASATKQYIAFDVALGANSTQTLTLGVSLGASDVVRVYASTAMVSFNIYGVEIT